MVVISEISIGSGSSLIEAIGIIDSAEAQIALVKDEQQRLLGTPIPTDGGNRRALLNCKTLGRLLCGS